MKGKNITNTILILVGLLFIGFGCSSLADIGKAEEKVDLFHQQMNNQKFEEIYENTHTLFKQNTNKDKTIKTFRDLSSEYGNLVSAKATNRESSTINGSTVVKLTYDSQYVKAKVIEDFEFVLENDELKLTYYNTKKN